jgi:hypothetical protein
VVQLFFTGLAHAEGEAMPPVETSGEDAEQLATATPDGYYLAALAAWDAGEVERALRLARKADDSSLLPHEPARLLAAYALLRLRRTDEGLAELAQLVEFPSSPGATRSDVRAAATRQWRRLTDRRRRDDVSIFLSGQLFGRPTPEKANIAGGYAVGVEFPLARALGVRLDIAPNSSALVNDLLAGPTLNLMATAHVPLGSGVWSLDLGVGPTAWILSGALTDDNLAPEPGLHGAAGVSVRPGRVFGLALETNAWNYPGMVPDLTAYMFTWDVRFSTVFWFPRVHPPDTVRVPG